MTNDPTIDQRIKLAKAEIRALEVQIEEQVRRGGFPNKLVPEYDDLGTAKQKLEELNREKIQRVEAAISDNMIAQTAQQFMVAIINNPSLIDSFEDLQNPQISICAVAQAQALHSLLAHDSVNLIMENGDLPHQTNEKKTENNTRNI